MKFYQSIRTAATCMCYYGNVHADDDWPRIMALDKTLREILKYFNINPKMQISSSLPREKRFDKHA